MIVTAEYLVCYYDCGIPGLLLRLRNTWSVTTTAEYLVCYHGGEILEDFVEVLDGLDNLYRLLLPRFYHGRVVAHGLELLRREALQESM